MRLKRHSNTMNRTKTQATNTSPLRNTARNLPIEFCDNCTIHGIRYVTERKRHWSERLWWVIAIGLSFGSCGLSIRSVWNGWHQSPIKISFTEDGVSIAEIPFPTVTICPKTKTTKDKLDLISIFYPLSLNSSNRTDTETKRLQAIAHLCSTDEIIDFEEKITNDSVYDTIKDIAPKIDIVSTCRWRDLYSSNCSELFVPILTEFGFCFAFNALNSRDIYTKEMAPGMMIVNDRPNIYRWSLETGFTGGFSSKQYPMRTLYSGYRAGLVVYLELMADDLEYVCHETGLGFIVTLTSPVETNEMTTEVFEVPLLENTQIAITPKIVSTSKNLRKYSPSDRQCYYNNERKLRFFKVYTENNCESECLANFTLKLCGCVKFSMPRDKKTRICGAGKVLCYLSAEDKLFEEDISDDLMDSMAESFRTKCNCLPACTSIDYEAKVDHLKFDLNIIKKMSNDRKFPSLLDRRRPSRLSIYFQEHAVERQQRIEAMTYIDFLSACGGLLGLFLGVSALSIVEFIYYFTLRLLWNIRQARMKIHVMPSHSSEMHDNIDK